MSSESKHTRNERFLDALVEELQTMSDTDALEGENAESLVKLGNEILQEARYTARRSESKHTIYESRASTHADDCWSWGPGHYKCAVMKIERLRQQRDQLLAALKAIVSNSMFEQRFDHCGFMNATALSDRDLFRKLWAKARDAIEKAEGRNDE